MTSDEIQSSADAASRLAAIHSAWGAILERVDKDAGVTRAALATVGCCLQVGATSWQGYLTMKAEARDLAQRFGLPALDLPVAHRVKREELESYLHAFISLLHQPPDPSQWEALVQQYDESARRDADERRRDQSR